MDTKKKEIIQKVFTLISFLMPTLIIGLVVFSIYFLPERIPVHFDFKWNTTRVGGQYELLLLGLVFYFIPIIIAMIYKNIKVFLPNVLGVISSICVSIIFYGIAINQLVRTFLNSQVVIHTDAGTWVSFVISIIGFACIILSGIVILAERNLILKKKNDMMLGNSTYNKINFILSIIIFLFGITICIGSTLLKNYYSFVVFFGGAAVYSVICFLALKFFTKKNNVRAYE